MLAVSRPRFWLYTLGPYVVSLALVKSDEFFDPWLWYGFFYFLLPANLLIYGVNDYFDSAVDQHNPKKYKEETRMTSMEKNLYRWWIFLAAICTIPLFFININIITSIVLFLFFGVFYSSPPFRLKTKVILDSFSNFFYIMPGVIGYVLVEGTFPNNDILIAASLWSVGMHLFSAVVDIDADKQGEISTTATFFGFRNSLLLTSTIWFISVSLVVHYSLFLLLGYVYPLLSLFVLIRKSNIIKVYWAFSWINALCGFILFLIVYAKNHPSSLV